MPLPLSPELRALQREVEGHARSFGLDFFETLYEVLDWEEINEVAAFGGYPARYPHWRFGMEYVELSRSNAYGLSRIYEMVINNDPTYAYLLAANHFVDQKLVMAHVCGHGDFFKHNFMFAGTNRKMLDEMANHSTRVRRYMERHGVEEVEGMLDRCLSIENLIDYGSPRPARAPSVARGQEEEGDGPAEPRKLRAKGYMEPYINPPEVLRAERERLTERARKVEESFPSRPERDVMLFLLEHAPLRNWERDVLGIVREEAYYFAPQGRTKIMNEGWACLGLGTLVFTDRGLIPIEDVVNGCAMVVSDGEVPRQIHDSHVIRERETVSLRTRRGLKILGSSNHRIWLADRATWRRLDELAVGDRVAVSGGAGLWPTRRRRLSWRPGERFTLAQAAHQAAVSVDTVVRYRGGFSIRKHREQVAAAVRRYESESNRATSTQLVRRKPVRIPGVVDERLAAFLGYLIGDGHISRVKRVLGLTTGDEPQLRTFVSLAEQLFGVMPSTTTTVQDSR